MIGILDDKVLHFKGIFSLKSLVFQEGTGAARLNIMEILIIDLVAPWSPTYWSYTEKDMSNGPYLG